MMEGSHGVQSNDLIQSNWRGCFKVLEARHCEGQGITGFGAAALHGGVTVAYVIRQNIGLAPNYAINQEHEVISRMAEVFSCWNYQRH